MSRSHSPKHRLLHPAALLALSAVVLLSSAVPAEAQADQVELPEPVYDIDMEASYDPEEFRIQGKQRLRWRNTSSVPVEELQFHHYLNAFSSNRSTFMEESGGRLRGDRFDGGRWGWIEVSQMRVVSASAGPAGEGSEIGAVTAADLEIPPGEQAGYDLKAVEQFIAPDDGNPEDRTVARYPLPRPVEPGGWIEVEIDFESQLPTIFARTGADREYVLAGQWYPKVAVFEDTGVRQRAEPGWNTRQFHAHSEFYADFGDYRVSLTLPERYEGHIGATGTLLEETVADGQVTARFAQEGVHDFAWTADPENILVEDTFEDPRDVPPAQRAEIAALLGVAESELELPPVTIRLFLQPPHLNQAGKYMEAAKAGIRGYGLRLGAYPWPTLTMVDPPTTALGSGGMEYPTFITLGTDTLLSFPLFEKIIAAETVTVHEFGHQYFQGMIANNEFEESWIDEGINSYYESVVVVETYGEVAEVLGIRRPRFENERTAISGGGFRDPIVTPSWKFYSRNSYGSNSYPRPAVTLRHLENLLGPETFARAMRAFFQEWRFRHPSTVDFEEAMAEHGGRDLEWFFRQAWHDTVELDYAVTEVRNREIEDRRGVYWENGERIELGDDAEGDEFADESEEATPEGDGDAEGSEDVKIYESTATVVRLGEFRHPVEVELRFEGGATERRTWDGEDKWMRWTFTRPERLVAAVVDPEHVLVLDVDRLNNGRYAEGEEDPTPARKVTVQFLFWLQNLMQAMSLFG